MEDSPPWDTNLFSASQEIPHIVRHSKAHYRVYKSPPPVHILNQIKDALRDCDFVHYDVQTVSRVHTAKGHVGDLRERQSCWGVKVNTNCQLVPRLRKPLTPSSRGA